MINELDIIRLSYDAQSSFGHRCCHMNMKRLFIYGIDVFFHREF